MPVMLERQIRMTDNTGYDKHKVKIKWNGGETMFLKLE